MSKTKQFGETSFLSDNQKQRNSARLPQFSKLRTSKTTQFCETSFKNGKLSAELTASYQCVLRFFFSICLKYCACHEKVRPGHTKCCTCHAGSFQQMWQMWGSDAPKCNPSQDQRPDLLTCLTREMHLCRSSSTPANVFETATKPARFALF